MPTYLSRAGLKKLQDALSALQKQRLELLEEVRKAAEMGDLRENAEYHAARERLQHISTQMEGLHSKLTQVQLTDDLVTAAGEARLGARVTLKDLQAKEQFRYVLVGPDEADPQQGRLSIASPLGKAMLGKKKGEQFTLTLPRAVVPYLVVNIDRP